MKSIAVIGGGFGSVGVALAAARAGYKVSLISKEREILAATSANSLRIVHGGLRYFQSLQLGRVVRSLEAQTRFYSEYKDSLRTLRSVHLLPASGLKRLYENRLTLGLLSSVYALLMRNVCSSLPSPKVRGMTGDRLKNWQFSSEQTQHAFCWYDYTISSLTTLRQQMMLELKGRGVEFLSMHTVKAVHRMLDNLQIVFDSQDAMRFDVVVNASGPGLLTIEGPYQSHFPELSYARAWNYCFPDRKKILPLFFSEEQSARVVAGKETGRLFMVQREEDAEIALGTFYSYPKTPRSIVHSPPMPLELAVKQYFPNYMQSVLSSVPEYRIETGFIPTVHRGKKVRLLSEDTFHIEENYVELVTTKLTTFLDTGDRLISALHKREKDA